MLKINSQLLAVMVLFASFSTWAQLSSTSVVTGEYIIKYKNNTSEKFNGKSAKLAAGQLLGKMGSDVSLKTVFAGSRMMHVKVSSESALNRLYSNPDIEFVEPNYILSVNPLDMSALGSAPQATDDYTQSNSNVQVKESWAIQMPYDQGTKTVVAVIDTGLSRAHQLFQDSGSIWENTAEKNGVTGLDDDGNGLVDDINGWNYVGSNSNVNDDSNHGTHVAGTILGVGQDVFAVPVRESKVKIMALKFLDSNGGGSTSNAISAIYYAVDKGAKVINNSWGGPTYSQSLHEAYTYAYEHGVVVVSAAGNSNSNNDVTPMYPSSFDTPNNISVLATTDSDNKASFSNYGAQAVTLAAPGVAILSSVPGTGCAAPGCFQMMSGTSMAAPFVAGLAALVIREASQLSAYQIKSIIVASVDTIANFSSFTTSGGRVNAYKSIESAKAQVGAPAWSPQYAPDYKSNRSLASDTTTDSAAPAGCGLVKVIVDNTKNGGDGFGGSSPVDLAAVIVMILLPLAMALQLRARLGAQQKEDAKEAINEEARDRRTTERYVISKEVALQVSGKIIRIMTEDISVGGISFKAEADLNRGQRIKVNFNENINEQIEAEVVWCAKQQIYGLRFLNMSDSIKFKIQSWTQGLTPT